MAIEGTSRRHTAHAVVDSRPCVMLFGPERRFAKEAQVQAVQKAVLALVRQGLRKQSARPKARPVLSQSRLPKEAEVSMPAEIA